MVGLPLGLALAQGGFKTVVADAAVVLELFLSELQLTAATPSTAVASSAQPDARVRFIGFPLVMYECSSLAAAHERQGVREVARTHPLTGVIV